jgi:hypothetical protein
MSINEKISTAACSLGPSVGIEIFYPFDTDFAIDIALL